MNAVFIMISIKPTEIGPSFGYIIGAIIALFVLSYMIYSLVKPEKF